MLMEYNHLSISMIIKFDTEIHKVAERLKDFQYNLNEIFASDTQQIECKFGEKAGISI